MKNSFMKLCANGCGRLVNTKHLRHGKKDTCRVCRRKLALTKARDANKARKQVKP